MCPRPETSKVISRIKVALERVICCQLSPSSLRKWDRPPIRARKWALMPKLVHLSFRPNRVTSTPNKPSWGAISISNRIFQGRHRRKSSKNHRPPTSRTSTSTTMTRRRMNLQTIHHHPISSISPRTIWGTKISSNTRLNQTIVTSARAQEVTPTVKWIWAKILRRVANKDKGIRT